MRSPVPVGAIEKMPLVNSWSGVFLGDVFPRDVAKI
jgi:hypothetical protein